MNTYTVIATLAWFNDCILGKLANPIIAKVDPVPYFSIHTSMFAKLLTENQ